MGNKTNINEFPEYELIGENQINYNEITSESEE